MSLLIRNATAGDAEAICRIYNPHVMKTIVTFEEVEVLPSEMAARIARVTQTFPWLVAEIGLSVAGYAYAAPFHERSAYRHSAVSTIYVHEDAQNRGVGTRLYQALLDDLQGRPVHAVLALISLPNPASVALHEKLGFQKAGQLAEVGFKFGHWVDVGYWQFLLKGPG